MKKTIYLSLVTLLSFVVILPVLAEENATSTQVASSNTTTTATSTKPLAVKKYVRRIAVVKGDLKEVRGTTELVVTVTSVSPKKYKKWIGAYPVIKTDMVIKLDGKTKFVRRYYGKSTLDELTVGDKLQVNGKTNEDGSFTANVVKDDSLHITLKVHKGLIDTLDAVNNSFVIKQSKSNVTVKVSDKTKIMVPGVVSSTFSNLKVGDLVHVRGIVNTKTKVIDASLVRVSLPKAEKATTTAAVTQ